ncbi:MAG: hypothetical protein GEV09_20800 [Pseudonocardiaceae bacterium]|nr:hypothetical protein [Pseudonocardiaceae bacterium]
MNGWVWDGGSRCIDLINTVRGGYRAGRDLLADPLLLAEWLRTAQLLARDSTPLLPEHVEQARTLREAVDRAAQAHADDLPIDPRDVAVINHHAGAAHQQHVELRLLADGRPQAWTPPPDDPVGAALGAVAVDAIRLLVHDPKPRLSICASQQCRIRFLDRSPAQNRQWCSMSRCGNRAKARRNHARSERTVTR